MRPYCFIKILKNEYIQSYLLRKLNKWINYNSKKILLTFKKVIEIYTYICIYNKSLWLHGIHKTISIFAHTYHWHKIYTHKITFLRLLYTLPLSIFVDSHFDVQIQIKSKTFCTVSRATISEYFSRCPRLLFCLTQD